MYCRLYVSVKLFFVLYRYIEVFRSTHAEIRPVSSRDSRWGRGTPYSRPGQWGDRGGHGGYGGYGSGGYGAKYSSGYERGGRGRGYGTRGGRGGGIPPAGGYDSYTDGGGSGGYSQYSQGGYDYNTQHGGYGQNNTSFGAPTGGPGGNDPNQMIAYPPIRSQSQGGRGGGEDSTIKGKHGIKMRGLPYSAEEKEILDFFLPHVPVKVVIEYNQYGRPSGTAEVMFSTHEDAEKAMEKHNGHMGEYSTRCCI